MSDAPDRPSEGSAPKRRVSVPRLLLVLVVVAIAAFAGMSWVRSALATRPAVHAGTWFAPYVDTTLTPTYPFESASQQPARQVVLGFVVASSSGACMPSWGAAYSLAGADQELSMRSRIAQLQDNGQHAIVSFGGAAHTPLWVACPTTTGLTQVYADVVQRYGLHVIDLDVEGTGLDNAMAMQRNAAAVKALEQRFPQLSVWMTLPVATSGLQDNARAALAAMLQARVALAGVNLMTMDFGPAPSAGTPMITPVLAALRAAHTQLQAVNGQYGVHLGSGAVWRYMGATVMIGQNDVTGERFAISDAHRLVAFARQVGLGRASMWSINRDTQCGSEYSVTGVLSNTCSGTPESTLGFSHVFGAMVGVVPAPTAGAASATLPPTPDTNPADAPFPLWAATQPYPAGYKVVENGLIYQALYYNTAADPSAQAHTGAQGPWQLVGPVLAGDHPSTPVRAASGSYPAWSASTGYHAGDRVVFQGEPYQAKWNNEGASPAGAQSDPYGNPWHALFTIPGEPSLP